MKDQSFNKLISLLENIEPTIPDETPVQPEQKEAGSVIDIVTQIEEQYKDVDPLIWTQVCETLASRAQLLEGEREEISNISGEDPKTIKAKTAQALAALRAKRQGERPATSFKPVGTKTSYDPWDIEAKRQAKLKPGAYEGD